MIEKLQTKIKALELENHALKTKQQEFAEARQLYLSIFDRFPAYIWRCGTDKLCNYFNSTWLEFTGRTLEQEMGNGWTEGVHPDDYDYCFNTFVTSFDKQESFAMEYRIKNKFGTYSWLKDYGQPIYDMDKNFIGYLGVCYDITENKSNESKLLELNATKDRFFGIIAHDLKSPFNSILGLSQLLQDQIRAKDYEQVDELVDLIKHSSLRATDLLINLTEWAYAQSGKMEYKPNAFDVVTLINEINLSLVAAAKLKVILIQSQLPARLNVFADKTMISAVIRNLLNNAIKFTNSGGRIDISAQTKENEVVISVKDNGIGMAKERIEKLFQGNENVSTPGTKKEKGTGLGLIICKEFIEKNKGRFWVESELDKGSTFYFSLPIRA